MSSRRAIVLDTSAFIAGFNPSLVNDEVYSVPEVDQELKKGPLVKIRFDAAVSTKKIKIREPSPRFLNIVRETSIEIGEMLFLSQVDMKVLALALQLKHEGCIAIIATDDYSIQNIAEKMGIKYTSLVTLGIRFYLRWLLYCPACRKKYPSDYKAELCEICGTRLKRKPRTKSLIEKNGIKKKRSFKRSRSSL